MPSINQLFCYTSVSLLFFVTSACTSIKEPIQSTASSTERIFSGKYSSPAWVSDDFEGSHTRILNGNTLKFELTETMGGFDTALAGTDMAGILVDDVHPNYKVCSNYQIHASGTGFYWAGPKISVNWQAMTGESDGIWYENYIVDTATMNAQEIEDWIYSIHKGKYLGTTSHDGSTYKHYLIHFNSWKQYYAVRQDYRDKGISSIYPILQMWRKHGLENLAFDGVKINIEFHGQINSKSTIKGNVPFDYSKAASAAELFECDE